MRQRLMIAMGMGCVPDIIIADEPTTALDVTIQAQLLELLRQQVERHRTALLLITHNLGIVARYADRVNVMYGGRIVETADAESLYARPRHPYTMGLLRSVPRLDQPAEEKLTPISASRRMRSPCRPAAPSIRAARMPSRAAVSRCRRCDQSATIIPPPAGSTSMAEPAIPRLSRCAA